MNKFVESYLNTAIEYSEFNNIMKINDFSQLSINIANNDYHKFKTSCHKRGILVSLEPKRLGRDFWLSRNHISRFWDGKYPNNTGLIFDEISKTFTQQYVVLRAGELRLHD